MIVLYLDVIMDSPPELVKNGHSFLRWRMPKVSDAYRLARRTEIVDAAIRAFARRGFQATSMAEIIAESGLSAGAIYGHFASKTDLVLAVAQRIVGARVDDMERLRSAERLEPPSSLLRVLLTSIIRDIGGTTMIVQLWGEAVSIPGIHDLTTDVFARLADGFRAYIAAWHQQEHGLLVDEAQRLAAEQAPLFLSAAQGYVVQSALLADFDSEGYLAATDRYLPR